MSGVTGPCPSCSAVISAPVSKPVQIDQPTCSAPKPTEITIPVKPPAPSAPTVTPKNKRFLIPASLALVATVTISFALYSTGIFRKQQSNRNGGQENTVSKMTPTPQLQTQPISPNPIIPSPPKTSTSLAVELPEPAKPSTIDLKAIETHHAPSEILGKTPTPTPKPNLKKEINLETVEGEFPLPHLSPPATDSRAQAILKQFLETNNLQERLELMSKSQWTLKQLEKTCLASSLKTAQSTQFAEKISRASDGMIQHFYYVSFNNTEKPHLRDWIVIQLVERPNIHPPRVHADAFIEHYEKKFKSYSAAPHKGITTFHCVAEIRSTSNIAENLPKDIKHQMICFKIKTHPHSEAVFNAFLNKNSPLVQRIGAGQDFPYAEPKICTLSFRWNLTHPQRPYIELHDIIAMGWEK